MKKFLALLLALVLVFALAACGEGAEVKDDGEGSTSEQTNAPEQTEPEETEPEETEPEETEPEQTGSVTTGELEGQWNWVFSVDGEMMGVEGFDGSLDLVVLMSFEDGDYSLSLDEDALMVSLDSFEQDLIDYMIELLYDSFTSQGLSREEADAQMELAGMGSSVADYVETAVAEMDLGSALTGSIESEEGEYIVEGDQLTLIPTAGEQSVYTFSVEGDTLELSGDDDSFKSLLEMTGADSMILERV